MEKYLKTKRGKKLKPFFYVACFLLIISAIITAVNDFALSEPLDYLRDIDTMLFWVGTVIYAYCLGSEMQYYHDHK